MKHTYFFWICSIGSLLLSAVGIEAADKQALPVEPLFSRHVVAVLAKVGCNAGGGCHGAPKGQNGFRLSLWGSYPAEDHEAIVRATFGRRINPIDRDASLLLLKPTVQVPHEGGKRLQVGSRDYTIIQRWLAHGALLDDVAKSQVQSFRLEPQERLARPGDQYQLRVEATFADGSVEDVTALCSFEVVEEAVAGADASGRVTVKGAGETPIFVRYRGAPLVSRLLVPNEPRGAFPQVQPHNFIDEEVLAKLRQMNVHPAALCDDATFLRRVSLDIAAELPAPEEVRAFLADTDAKKREKKIDELLRRPGHAALWATKWTDMIRPERYNQNFGFTPLAETRRIHDWLGARVAENLPYDQFVERILTATSYEGRSREEWIEEAKALGRENAEEKPELPTYAKRQTLDLYWQREVGEVMGVRGSLKVAYLFLGLQFECAQCHRHPHDVWQQADILDFANFFNQMKSAANASGSESKDLQQRSQALRAEAKQATDKAKADELTKQANALDHAFKRLGTAIYPLEGNNRWVSITSPLGTHKSQQFRLPGAAQPIKVPANQDPRQIVMKWLRDHKSNPYLARAAVNRVWAHYLGRGIVNPPDNLSLFNPPTHPRLLDKLADEFVAHGYDLRWLHRTIVMSRAYQQSSATNVTSRDDRKNYASFYLRRLPVEVLIDAVNHATGSKVIVPDSLFVRADAKAIEYPGDTLGPPPRRVRPSLSFAFELFGRPKRDLMMMCDCERDNGTNVMHTVFLANNPRVRDQIAAPTGRIAQLVKQFDNDRRRVEELFLWVVSRPQTADELTACLDYLKESPSAQKGLEDVLWSLLNTREFILVH